MLTELNTKEIEILKPFFSDPELDVSMRELSRRSGVSPGWISKNISELVDSKILKIEEENVSKKVSTGERFSEAKRIYNLDQIQSSELVGFLEENLRPDAIVLFGSYEKGEDQKDSDIDIAVINGRVKDLNLEKFEQKFERKISIQNIEKPDEGDENFRNSLANGTVLKGHLKAI